MEIYEIPNDEILNYLFDKEIRNDASMRIIIWDNKTP